jgi:hypothetical protein
VLLARAVPVVETRTVEPPTVEDATDILIGGVITITEEMLVTKPALVVVITSVEIVSIEVLLAVRELLTPLVDPEVDIKEEDAVVVDETA